MTDDKIITFPTRPSLRAVVDTGHPGLTIAQIDGARLGALAIDQAEGDYAAAVKALGAGIEYIRQRHLVDMAKRLLDRQTSTGPGAA